MQQKKWNNVINVNLNGIYCVAQAFAKYLIDHGKTGNIVNTASMSGTIVNVPQEQASYNASKAGVRQLTKSLAGGVSYLLSDASTYTSGTDLIMDGCFTSV